jgi:acyl dehydratase
MSARPHPVVGDTLPPLSLPPLTRAALALYAGGSGDHIPLHIDSDFARAAGHPDVFMHGMLGAGYVARMLTTWAPQACLQAYGVRFTAITWPGEALTATGTVTAVGADGQVTVAVALRNAAGETKAVGEARLQLDHPGEAAR